VNGYDRVLPRDLFNEADLLKCMGRLSILLGETQGHCARIVEETVSGFRIAQDPSNGSIEVANLTFEVAGIRHRLVRPLNSREAWPLRVEAVDPASDFESLAVFDDDGSLSDDFADVIQAP
jgi:hypothetical protein